MAERTVKSCSFKVILGKRSAMRWNLAYRTLMHDRGKLVAGLVGVIFSVVLVNLQGGLFFGLIQKASMLIDRSEADIWIGHRGMHNVDFPHSIPERWEHVVAGVPGVSEVEPLRIAFGEFTLPDGGFENVVIVGVPRDAKLAKPFKIVEGPPDALNVHDAIVVDDCDHKKLADPQLGELREINRRRVRVTGKSHGVLSFLVTPYVFTDYDRVVELSDMRPDHTSYLLAKVNSGVDAGEVCDAIEEGLPHLTAMTSKQYSDVSIGFWMTRTGIGISFGAATLLGLLVGVVMVGHTLYAMVLDHISEYATLRAIGMNEHELLTILIIQSALVALMGIGLGTALTMLLQGIFSTPQAAIEIPGFLYLGCGALIFCICLIASGLPYLRVRHIDPHQTLQG